MWRKRKLCGKVFASSNTHFSIGIQHSWIFNMQIEIVVFYLSALEIFFFFSKFQLYILRQNVVVIFALSNSARGFSSSWWYCFRLLLYNGFCRTCRHISSSIWYVIIYLWIRRKKARNLSYNQIYIHQNLFNDFCLCACVFCIVYDALQNKTKENKTTAFKIRKWHKQCNNSFSIY